MKTIIFMSGIFVPKWLAQSKFIWDKFHWEDYHCIWLKSKIPYSDMMVAQELDRLESLIAEYPDATLAGHSLGAWWASNLICRKSVSVKKTVLWTPLTNANHYPIFNVTPRYHPCNQSPNPRNIGPHKVLVAHAQNDLIVPQNSHAFNIMLHFQALSYTLMGGHFYQSNHGAALRFMKDWIDL